MYYCYAHICCVGDRVKSHNRLCYKVGDMIINPDEAICLGVTAFY